MGGAEELVQKFAAPVLNFIVNAIPFIISIAQKCYAVYKRLPMPYVQFIIGTVMCFFGGIYPTVFAALQVSSSQFDSSHILCTSCSHVILKCFAYNDLILISYHIIPHHRLLNTED